MSYRGFKRWKSDTYTHTHTRTYIRTPAENHIFQRFRLLWVLWHYYLEKKFSRNHSFLSEEAKKVGARAATYTMFLIFLFRCYIHLFTNEAVLNINALASGITKLIFMRWKTRNPVSSPIPEHENNRFWLFRDKFVIIEAVLNIIVQATAFARVFFLHKGLKNERAIVYLKIVFF